jgi:hypothetical protein
MKKSYLCGGGLTLQAPPQISSSHENLGTGVTRRIRRRRDTDPVEGRKKYGNTVFADPTNKKYPIDTPGRIKAAWAYIHQPRNAAKYSATERRTIRTRIAQAAKRRNVTLPDPDEFIELMARVRRRRRKED